MAPRFDIEEVFSITGRGTVVTGKYPTDWDPKAGDTAYAITRADEVVEDIYITGIEMFRPMIEVAKKLPIGILLRQITKEEALEFVSLHPGKIESKD